MRRAFVWMGLAMLGLVALPAASTAADLEKVRVSIIPIGDVAPLFAAVQNGYFREVGLEIDTTPSAGGAAGIPGLVGGSFDVAYGNVVSALLAAQQGLDVKVIAAGTNVTDPKLDATGIFAKSNSGIKSGKDLEGKSIAVNTRNNVIWLYARAWIKATGGDPERVTFKEVPFPQMEDALRQQRVDAAFMVPPFSIVAAQKGGLARSAVPIRTFSPASTSASTSRPGKLLATKPETMKKFVAALRKGVEWYNANLTNEALLTLISGYTKADVALLKLAPVPTAPAPHRHLPGQEDDGADDREQAAAGATRPRQDHRSPGALGSKAFSREVGTGSRGKRVKTMERSSSEGKALRTERIGYGQPGPSPDGSRAIRRARQPRLGIPADRRTAVVLGSVVPGRLDRQRLLAARLAHFRGGHRAAGRRRNPAFAGRDLRRAAIGYVAARPQGSRSGLCSARNRVLRYALLPLIEIVRPMPTPAVIPPLILLLGVDDALKIFIVAMASFFPVFTNTFAGVASVDDTLIQTARTFRTSSGSPARPRRLPRNLAGDCGRPANRHQPLPSSSPCCRR